MNAKLALNDCYIRLGFQLAISDTLAGSLSQTRNSNIDMAFRPLHSDPLPQSSKYPYLADFQIQNQLNHIQKHFEQLVKHYYFAK